MATTYHRAFGQPDWTEAVPQGKFRLEYPFGPANPDTRIIYQDMVQIAGAINYPSVNSRPPPSIYSGAAYYCHDTPRIPIGGNLCRFTRVWASKPTQILEYENIVVQYPARAGVYFDYTGPTLLFNHTPYIAVKGFSLPRRAKIIRDFFLIGNTGIEDYGDPAHIPVLDEDLCTDPDVTSAGAGPFMNDEWDAIRGVAQNIGIFSGAILAPDTSNPPTGTDTRRIAAALSTGGRRVGQSTLSRWMGNIWERRVTEITL